MIGFNWLVSCQQKPEEIENLPKEWFEINDLLMPITKGQPQAVARFICGVCNGDDPAVTVIQRNGLVIVSDDM